MGAWHETEEALLKIECDFQPICPYCHKKLVLYTAKIIRFNLDAKHGKRGHAVDCEMVCPKCRYWQVQGVPVSEEHYQEISEAVAKLHDYNNTEEGKGDKVGKDT